MLDASNMVNVTESDDELTRFFGIRHSEESDEFESCAIVSQNHVPILTENYYFKLSDTRNGFSKSRSSRKIASVPSLAMVVAKDEGWDLDDQNELRRWLTLHPEFLTVDAIKTNRQDSNIIIK